MSSLSPTTNLLEPIHEDATVEVVLKNQRKLSPPKSPESNFKFFPKSTSLFRLKCTTAKLGLNNRRPSIEAWKQEVKKKPLNYVTRNTQIPTDHESELTNERIDKMNLSLEWLRSELLEMRKQDQTLASEFLRIKQTIYDLKLEWSCEDHQCMLDGAETEMDVLEELRRVTDLPLQTDLDLSLKEKGFTKLNVCSRRYSLA